MAAGLGFKDFVTGEVLTAADVDGYLMQNIWVFANATARDAAVTSPQEGNACYLKDTDAVMTYSGSAWVAVGGSVPASYGLSAGKNKIINGDFGVWQRGTTFTPSAAWNYNADRFAMYCAGSGHTPVVSRQTFTPGTAPVAGYEGLYFWRYSQAAAGSGNTTNNVAQRIENVQTFAGQQVTVSFWGKADAARTVTSEFYQEFGSGGSAGVSTSIGSHSFTTSWQRFTTTVTVPSISGKTVGTNSYLTLQFILPTGVAQTIDFWGVQVENGSTATAFQTATGTIQGELAACQRYYFRNTQTANNQHLTPFGSAVSSTAAAIDVFFPVPMRTNPTAIESANLAVTDGANARTNVTSVTFNAASNLVANCEYNVASGLTQYRPYSLFNQTSTTAYVGFSAEL
jgi:hypothetical protein